MEFVDPPAAMRQELARYLGATVGWNPEMIVGHWNGFGEVASGRVA